MHAEINEGAVFEVAPFPFVVERARGCDEEGYFEFNTWRPGVSGDDGFGQKHANGEGAMILTVVAVFKPGRYPTRVFFTRKWRAPNGKIFGSNALKVATVAWFKQRLRGYLCPYSIEKKSL